MSTHRFRPIWLSAAVCEIRCTHYHKYYYDIAINPSFHNTWPPIVIGGKSVPRPPASDQQIPILQFYISTSCPEMCTTFSVSFSVFRIIPNVVSTVSWCIIKYAHYWCFLQKSSTLFLWQRPAWPSKDFCHHSRSDYTEFIFSPLLNLFISSSSLSLFLMLASQNTSYIYFRHRQNRTLITLQIFHHRIFKKQIIDMSYIRFHSTTLYLWMRQFHSLL